MLRDEDCDPDLLAIGIRAPKLTRVQRMQNYYRPHAHGGWKPQPPKPVDPAVRRAARQDNYLKILGVGIGRGATTRKK